MRVHPSGYYKWKARPESDRERDDRRLLEIIKQLWLASDGVYGYLQSVDPHNVDNIRIYSEALLEVWCRTEGGQPSFEVPVSNRPDAMVTPTVRKSRSRTDAGRRIKSEPQKNHQPEALK